MEAKRFPVVFGIQECRLVYFLLFNTHKWNLDTILQTENSHERKKMSFNFCAKVMSDIFYATVSPSNIFNITYLVTIKLCRKCPTKKVKWRIIHILDDALYSMNKHSLLGNSLQLISYGLFANCLRKLK